MNGDEIIRKLINQAFFSKILVTEEGVVGWEYNQPFALLMAAHGAPDTTHVLKPASPTSGSKARTVGLNRRPYQRKRPSLLARAFCVPSLKDNTWRKGWDLNPRRCRTPQRFSRPAHSSALAPFRAQDYRSW